MKKYWCEIFLRLPSGSTGVVIDVRVFNRHGIEKDERSITIERAEIELVQEDKSWGRNIKQEYKIKGYRFA